MNIALITPMYNQYSETFIQGHINGLKGNVQVLHGGTLPSMVGVDNYLLDFSLPKRIYRKAASILFNIKYEDFLAKAVRKYLQENKIQLVFAEYGLVAADVSDICNELNIPLIAHFHGYDAFKYEVLDEYLLRYKKMFKSVRYIVAVSENMKQQLVKLGADEKRIEVIPCGANTEKFKPVENCCSSDYFLFVGRFVDKKAPHHTITAFGEVVKKCPAARLKMVGDGPLLEKSVQLASTLGIKDKVEFCGTRSSDEVSGLMANALAYVQHSVIPEDGDSEGMPVAVMEAGAAGIPVVSTRHAGIPEVVIEGETGFLVDEHDVSAMAGYMEQLFNDRSMARKFGAAARERINEKFSLSVSIGKLNELVDKAI